MPLEYRLIQFAEKDIEAAVDRWLRANGELGNYGRIGTIKISESSRKIRADVSCWEVEGKTRRNQRQLALDHEEIGQAIVLFCKDHAIPLSRKGAKIFRLLDKRIAMYYQLT